MDYTQIKRAGSPDNPAGNFFTEESDINQETPPGAGGEPGLDQSDFSEAGASSPLYEDPSGEDLIAATMPPESFPPDQTNASSLSLEGPAALGQITSSNPAPLTGRQQSVSTDQDAVNAAEAAAHQFRQGEPGPKDITNFYDNIRGGLAA